MSDEKTLKAATTVLFAAGYDGLASEVAKARKSIERDTIQRELAKFPVETMNASEQAWLTLKVHNPRLDGCDSFFELQESKRLEYVRFAQVVVNVTAGVSVPAQEPRVFKVGDPEPKDKASIVLTDGKSVFRWGTEWNARPQWERSVDGKDMGWDYWDLYLDQYGPLAEVLEG